MNSTGSGVIWAQKKSRKSKGETYIKPRIPAHEQVHMAEM